MQNSSPNEPLSQDTLPLATGTIQLDPDIRQLLMQSGYRITHMVRGEDGNVHVALLDEEGSSSSCDIAKDQCETHAALMDALRTIARSHQTPDYSRFLHRRTA